MTRATAVTTILTMEDRQKSSGFPLMVHQPRNGDELPS
jgi:hypothetical protein